MADNDPTPTPAPKPDPTPTPAPKPEAEPDKTFSQTDVDRIVQERLARDRKDRPSDDELKELKAAAKKLADLEEANASDLEKANKRAEKAEADALKATETAKETAVRAAIIAEAATKNAANPKVIATLIDRASIEFDGDGNPTNIAEAVDSLLKAEPYLVSGGNAHEGADQGARGGSGVQQLTVAELKNMTPAEVKKAEAEGRTKDLAQGS